MRVIVGRIGRPHGVRGDLVISVRTDEPDERFAVGSVLDRAADEAWTRPGQALTVTAKRWHSGNLLVGFAGITDRTAAAALSGTWLSVDSSTLPATADPDEFRDHELIGLVVRTTGGDHVGVVDDVLHLGQDILVVRGPGAAGRECLIPFVAALVPEVDVPAGVLVIDPPPGLLDLNQAL
jgi:16S rRNA processing protein RimM